MKWVSSILAIGFLLWGSFAYAVGPACQQLPNAACASGDPATQTITTEWSMATGKAPTMSNFGELFTASDTNPSCGAGEYRIYADLSEGKLKKCQDTTLSDLDTNTGSAPKWNSISTPDGNQALGMGANTTTWTWGNTTGAGTNMFSVTDTGSNTGTGYVAAIQTAASSAAKPLRVTAGGTTNGVDMSTAGKLAAIGTGSILANDLVVASQGAGDLVYFNNTNWVRLAAGSTSQVLVGGTTPAFGSVPAAAIGAGALANALVWNETPSGTWPNYTLTNSPRTVDTDLVIVNGLVLTKKGSACAGEANMYTAATNTVTMCDTTLTGTPVVRVVYEK